MVEDSDVAAAQAAMLKTLRDAGTDGLDARTFVESFLTLLGSTLSIDQVMYDLGLKEGERLRLNTYLLKGPH